MPITGELPDSEVEHALYAVHFWAKDTRNHRYLRVQLDDPVHHAMEAQYTRERYVIPGRWAFRSELSQELDDKRDTTRDCPSCFRVRR